MRYYHIWFQTRLKKYMLVDDIDRRIHELFKFWARKYGAKEVAPGRLQIIADYIRNQKKDLHVV